MADIGSILINIGNSLNAVVKLVTGSCYLIGLLLVWTSIKKLKGIADKRARYASGGKMFIPMSYLLGGAVFIYLPTALNIAHNTFFGMGSPIAYGNWLQEFVGQYGDIAFVSIRLLQAAGIIWFVRGTLLLVQASEPGVQHGPKGLAFLVGGIFAMNIQHSAQFLSDIVAYLAHHGV